MRLSTKKIDIHFFSACKQQKHRYINSRNACGETKAGSTITSKQVGIIFTKHTKYLMTILLNEERGMDDSAERKRTRPKMEDNEKERMIRQQRRNGVWYRAGIDKELHWERKRRNRKVDSGIFIQFITWKKGNIITMKEIWWRKETYTFIWPRAWATHNASENSQ